ncbi:MAG: hypothetical protein JRJ69_09455, partial [Deltaproteobacteria bacterium]|nr:hypothetical protein [Deltaproteobacteria bacterium]
EFSDEVWEIINDIEAGAAKPTVEPEPKKEEKVDLAKLVNDTKKLKDLKALVESHDEFAPLRDNLDSYSGLHGPRKLKEDMLRKIETKGAPSPPTASTKKSSFPGTSAGAGQKKKYTRIMSVCDVLKKGGISEGDLAKEADLLYSSKGRGKENLKESRYFCKRIVSSLRYLGYLREEDGKLFLDR